MDGGNQTRDPRAQGLKVAAYGVHVFTATGALLSVLALAATIQGQTGLAFFWLGIAMLVDGIDGTFARMARVEERAPRYDGTILDLVIDYTTYVFVPAAILLIGGYLPPGTNEIVLGLMCLTAALYFSDTKMKTEEGGFLGFPACWNVIVFYIGVFQPNGWVAIAVIVVFSALQFAPIAFLHPIRVTRFRVVNLGLLALWSAAALGAVIYWGNQPVWVQGILAVVGLWFLVIGALGSVRTRTR
jgi:phosphatidylcholine synthase